MKMKPKKVVATGYAFLKCETIEKCVANDYCEFDDGSICVAIDFSILDFACHVDGGFCGMYSNRETAESFYRLSKPVPKRDEP